MSLGGSGVSIRGVDGFLGHVFHVLGILKFETETWISAFAKRKNDENPNKFGGNLDPNTPNLPRNYGNTSEPL